MARFFKYRSASDLLAENERLGIDLRLADDPAPLFLPVTIGSRLVGNRLCVQPMEGCDGTRDGGPSDLTFRRYRRFATGGAKLIWGEATAVTPDGRANPRQLVADRRHLPAMSQLGRETRRHHREAFGDDSDLLLGLQLTHSGRYSIPRPILVQRDPLLDPLTVVDRQTGRKVDASDALVSDEYLARLIDAYVDAAKFAFDAGFDFVDIKQCHRYLLNELLAAKDRPGTYGGCFENRTRLAREIFRAIRPELPDLLLATRINVYDGPPFVKGPEGTGQPVQASGRVRWAFGVAENDPLVPDLSEPMAWIREMVQLGVSLVNVSLGNPYTSPHLLRPFEYPPPDGYDPPEHPLVGVDRHFRLTAEVQAKFPDLAIVGSGYSYLQEFLPAAGAANIRDGRVTMVGFGRASLAQPDLPRRLCEDGAIDRRRICRTFSYCTALMRSKHNELGQFATGCPPFDKEIYGPIWQQARNSSSSKP
ncbi:MAG: NADH:flavin oxidoreductase [Gemmataceae bacterium]|nr:NADH:flavin oxidoreductase [Gemmataceae bacterium]